MWILAYPRVLSLWRGRDLKGYYPPFLLYLVLVSRSPLLHFSSYGGMYPSLTIQGTIPSGCGMPLLNARGAVSPCYLVSA